MSAEHLPCGCIVDKVGDAFVMQPCGPDCRYYRYAMREAQRRGMPQSIIVDPEAGEAAGECESCHLQTRITWVNPLGFRVVGCVNPLCPARYLA